MPAAATEAPVLAFDGMPLISSTDLESDGFGGPWGITRTWTGLNSSASFGNGWTVNQLPYLVMGGLSAIADDPTPDTAPNGSYPDLRLSAVEGNDSYDFAADPANASAPYAPWNGQPLGLSLVWDQTNGVIKLTDQAGNVTSFYDVDRDPTTHQPLIGYPTPQAGKFKSYTTADGTVTISSSYNSDGTVASMTRSNASTGQSEELDFTYSTVTNDLVTAASGTPPTFATGVAWKQGGTIIRQASYDYYTGRLSNGTGGYTNDPNGRLGDLRTVQIKDGFGNIISQDYYRYYKLTGESTYTGDQGPTNVSATTAGPDPLQPAFGTYDAANPYWRDVILGSGLKTVVQGASFDRMAAAVSNYQTASDSAIQPYVNNFFNYERWGDHVGADGLSEAGSADYNNGNGYGWRLGYRFTTQYRATEEIAQGSGCSSCSGGEGTYKYEYAGNYYVDYSSSGTYPGVGYGVIDYNTWRMKTTEYLPDDTPSTWADNDREVIYSNEVGQPLLDVAVHVSSSPIAVTAMSILHDGLIQVTAASHGLSTGDTIALSGVLPELFNGIYKVTVVDANTFDIVVPETYAGNALPTPYVDSAYNGDGSASKVLSEQATYYRYDDAGRLIEQAAPSAVTGWDDSQLDLVDAATASGVSPLGLISPSSGMIQTFSYAGWAFDGRAGITANASALLGSGGPSAPAGTQAGYLQDLSVVSQTVSGWSAGTYTLSFSAAEVAGASTSTESFAVYLDNTLLTFAGGTSNSVAPSSSYASFTTDSFTVPAGIHQIRFVGLGDTTMGTAMIDNVSVGGTGAPTVTDGSFETDSLGSGNFVKNPQTYALTATSSVGGRVSGYLDESFVQQGQNGAPIPQESFTYYAHTAGGTTIFPMASDTVYGNTDGTDARTTRDSYQYHSGTNALQSETVTAPPITSTQDGPASSTSDTSNADTTTTYFDHEGRVTWTKDGGGFLTYTAYDELSGGVTKSITDVNTADTSDFSGLPSGWTTPSGGGLELITTYQVDALGRTTKMTDPNGNVTYTVYNDPGHETRVYPGWHQVGSNWVTTGPIEVTREYRPASGSGDPTIYDETLTSSATPTSSSGVPTGLETLAASNIQSLSRSITNSAGQMVKEDDYFSLAGVTYSRSAAQLGSSSNDSSTGNYHETQYHYNARGWQDKVIDPTGTITRTVYDNLHRVVSTWVGTSDTPASGYWSPPNNTSPSNMVDIADYSYDQKQAGPAAPAVGETTGGTDWGATYYVQITYVTAGGESAASSIVPYTLDDYDLLTVTSPASSAGATGYNVYVGTAGGPLMLQNASPVPIGTNWTAAITGVTPGRSVTMNGTGDSNLTQVVQHPGGSTADRVTLDLYDWRDRLIASKQGALLLGGSPDPSGETDSVHRLITFSAYDNLGERTASRTYAGDGVNLNDFATWAGTTDASSLRAYTTAGYDDQGRVYQSATYSVDPSSGTVGSDLVTNTFYDHRGNVIETSASGGIVTKHSFDGAGRDVKDSTTDGGVINGATQNWSNALVTTNEVVIEQSLNTYDADGNLIETVSKQRFDNDATSATGDLGGPSSGVNARVYFSADYYDAANRPTDSVNVGTNGGSSWTRPGSVPSRSDTVLVTHTDYDSAGRVLDTVDPRGIASATYYDLLGRTTKTIAAWDGTGSTPTPTSSSNQITTYTYNGNGSVLTQTAVTPSGTNSQTTAYVYGVALGTYNFIASNDLLLRIEYPDPSTGAAGTASSDKQIFDYDALGEKIYFVDQNQTTHQYSYDPLGRLILDSLPWYTGSGVDDSTTAHGFTYNDAGLPFQQTTFGYQDFHLTKTQDQEVYNGYGQLLAEYQSSYGAVNTSSTPYVGYAYSQPSGANYSRVSEMLYPNGRILDYGYNTGLDATISRVSYQADDGGSSAGTHLADYTYLGLSTIVQQANPEASQELTYIHQSGDTLSSSDGGDRYTGLDRFGRVIDQYWLNTSSLGSGTVDRLQYGYDRDGNVLYSKNLVNGSFSELYHANSASSGDNSSAYDSLNRLTTFRRGTLTSSGNNGSSLDTITSGNLNSTSGVPNQNSWNLDAIANWNSSSPGGTSETNAFNSQNEETTHSSSTLTYDNNGNMTVDQNGLHYVYDAWNNLIYTYDSSDTTLLETRYYDASNRIDSYNANVGIQTWYYSAQNQFVQLSFGSTYTQMVYGLGYKNDLILRDRNTDDSVSTGNLGKTGSGLDERIYAQHDANYDVISLVSQTGGSILKRYVYDPYGNLTILDSSWASSTDGTLYWGHNFQGGLQVGPGGLYIFGARLYSPSLGRWVQQDPAGYVNGESTYQLEGSDPLNALDPSGLFLVGGPPPITVAPWLVGVGVAGGVGLGFWIYYSGWGNRLGTTPIGNRIGLALGPSNPGWSSPTTGPIPLQRLREREGTLVDTAARQLIARITDIAKDKTTCKCPCYADAGAVIDKVLQIFGPAEDWPMPRAFFSHYEAALDQSMNGPAQHLSNINNIRLQNGQGALPPPAPNHLQEVRDMNEGLKKAVDALRNCVDLDNTGANLCSAADKSLLMLVYEVGRQASFIAASL